MVAYVLAMAGCDLTHSVAVLVSTVFSVWYESTKAMYGAAAYAALREPEAQG